MRIKSAGMVSVPWWFFNHDGLLSKEEFAVLYALELYTPEGGFRYMDPMMDMLKEETGMERDKILSILEELRNRKWFDNNPDVNPRYCMQPSKRS